MSGRPDITGLGQMIERLATATDEGGRVRVGAMLEVVGQKSFGPLILFAGLIAFSPLSAIPGVPTVVALVVLLTAGQMLFWRRRFWLPPWLLRRTVSREKYDRTLRRMAPVARGVDRFFRPRLTPLTNRAGAWFVAAMCVLIALTLPPLEFVPFAATTSGAALTVLGLALIARDGLMVLAGLAGSGTVAMFVIDALM